MPHFNMASLDITNIYKHPGDRSPDNFCRHYETESSRSPNTTRTDEMVWNNQWTKLLHLQQQYPDSERRPSNGCTIIRINSRVFPTTHRTSTHGTATKETCYVDDILIIFDPNHSGIQNILANFNTLHPNLQFTAEMEENKTINYLDITIHRTPSNSKIAIYRKPTFTDTIIPYTSNHPLQHKHTAVKFLYNRLQTYDLQPDEFLQEENTIQNILYKNSFPIQPHKPHHPKPQK